MPFIGDNGNKTKTPNAGAAGSDKPLIKSVQQAASDAPKAPKFLSTYTLKLNNGSTYELTQSQVDWIKNRYQSTVAEAKDYDFGKTYRDTTLDKKLLSAGLPSEKYIEKFISAYSDWYGDGQSYNFDGGMKNTIANKFKSDWTYEYTIEDQKRKAAGQMPLAIEAKYGDNRRDYELMKQGLPPESMLSDYVGAFETNEKNIVRANDFYDAVTREVAKVPNATDADMQKIYFDMLAKPEWADVDAIHQKSSSGEMPAFPELSDYESAASARRKEQKQAASGDAFVSYDDFASQYLKRKSKVQTDVLTDSAVGKFSTANGASTATKKDVQDYVAKQPKENYADTFASLYNSGASLTRLRDAERTMLDGATDPAQKKAIRDEFAKYQIKFRDQKYSASETVDPKSNWWEDLKSDLADSRKRREQDRIFKTTIEQPYNNGETSSVGVDAAKKIFESHLQYDKNGKATDESIEAATAFLKSAGASSPIIKRVVRDTIGAKEKFDIWSAIGGTPSDGTLVDTAAAREAAASVDVEDRTAVAESMREKLVGNGTMTDYEFDQMLRRNGWSDTISDERAAADYYTEYERPRYEANGEVMRDWKDIDAQTKAGYIADFKANAPYNPEIHKSFDEQVEGQSIGGIFAKAYLQTLSGTVNAIDMMTGADQWESSKVLADAAARAQSYGKSNQSVGSKAFGMASDISSELVRMYALSAAGSGIASMAFGSSGAIATVAGASTAATKGLNALAKAGTFLVKSSPFITSAMGGYYSEALRSGANVQQATLYGVVCGTLEGATEALNTSMWLERGFGASGFAKQLIKGGGAVKAGDVLLNAKITNLVASAIGEFAEESLSYVGSWAMQKATYDKNAQFDFNEMVKQGGMGALVGLFGAGLSLGSITEAGMISDFLNTEAGMKWATGKGASATRDLLMHSMVTESLSPETRAKLQMQEGALSVEDHDAVVRDVEQHTRQMDAQQKQYTDDVAKIDAELAKKQNAVTLLTTNLEQAAADKSAAGMKKWSKIAAQLQVAQEELHVEQKQAAAKRTERDAAFTETQEQHKVAIAKAQQKFVGHAVAMTEAFAPEISEMGEAAKSGVVPSELGKRILSKMSAARAGKLLDYVQTQAEIQQNAQATSPAQPAGDAQSVEAPTVQPTAENASIVSTEPRVTNAADALSEYKAELEAMASENQTSIEDRLSFSGEELPYVRVGLKVSKSASDKAIGTVKDHFKSWRGMAIHEQFQREVDGVVLQVLSDNPKYTENPDAIVSRLTNAFKHVSIDYNPTDMGYKGYDGREIESIRTLMRSQAFALGYYKNDGKLKRDFDEETRKSAFGSIMLKKKATKRGEVLSNIDTFYAEELTPRYPDLFPEEISTPQDQLDKMVEFMKATKRQEGVSIYNVDGGVTAYEIASHTADGLINDLIGAYNELRTQRGTKSNDNTGKAAETARVIAQADSSTQTSQPETVAEKSEATPANPAETMEIGGISVGAMTSKKGLSDGKTAISQFYSNTLETMDTDQHTQDVRDALQAFDEAYSYDVVSEKESIAKAQEVLARGITPELISELRSKNTWTGVDVDVAMAVKESYRQAGIETGDMNDYINWTLLIADRVGEGGRAIQALAKYTRDIKEKSIVLMQKNVNKSDKSATPKQKSKVSEQTDKIAKVVDEALKTNATPDAVESEVTKVAKKQTAKSIKDAFIRLQNKQIDRAAFDEHVNKAVKQENGLSGFTTEDAKRVINLLDMAEQQTDSYERRRYQSMAAQIVANTEPVSKSEKFRSLQRIQMLLNPKTMIKNIAANPIFMGAEWINDAPATLVDKIVSNWTGERTTTVSIEKQKAWFEGARRGTSEALKDVKYGVNTGRGTGKYEMTGKDVWKSKWMNSFDKAVGYGLNLGDRPFYEGAYDEFLMNEKLLGHDIESNEVQERVIGLALDRVFQAKPKFAEFVLKARNTLDSSGFPIGTLALPFAQTPANLADKILDYSIGTARALFQLGKSKKTGEFDQKLFVDRIGRSITGKGLMILGFSLAKAGLINLAGDDDKERQAMKNAGVTQYSLQLGDVSVSINWAEPVGSVLIMGAQLAKSGANSDALNVIDSGKMLINSFFDNSVLQNLTNLLSNSNGDVAGGIFNFLLGTTTQFMPSSVSAVAKATDKYERDTYDPNPILQQGKKLLTYFPGLRQLLPFKYGTDGKPVASNYGDTFFGRVYNTMLNPALVDKKSGDAVNDEIYRLYQGGYTDQLLPVAAKTLANTTLTASQRRELQQMLGEATYNAAQRIIESVAYQSLTDDEKVAALADAVDSAARDAREAFKNKLGK